MWEILWFFFHPSIHPSFIHRNNFDDCTCNRNQTRSISMHLIHIVLSWIRPHWDRPIDDARASKTLSIHVIGIKNFNINNNNNEEKKIKCVKNDNGSMLLSWLSYFVTYFTNENSQKKNWAKSQHFSSFSVLLLWFWSHNRYNYTNYLLLRFFFMSPLFYSFILIVQSRQKKALNKRIESLIYASISSRRCFFFFFRSIFSSAFVNYVIFYFRLSFLLWSLFVHSCEWVCVVRVFLLKEFHFGNGF